MAKIVLRRVDGFNRDQLLDRSIVKFLDFRGRNSPFGRTLGNLVTTRARFLFSYLTMPYPNITNQKSQQVYSLSTSVKGVDGEV